MKEISYRLAAIYDREGNRWEEVYPECNTFCDNLVGCIARNICQTVDAYSGMPMMKIDLIQGRMGKFISGIVEIQSVEDVREVEGGYLEIVTTHCVYRFEPVRAAQDLYHPEGGMIELYLCNEHIQFDAGLYVDGHSQTHVLEAVLNLGTVHHDVSVVRQDRPHLPICKYIPRGERVEFNSMIYHQEEYAARIVVHNSGTSPLKVSFERHPEVWTIQPGEGKRLTRQNCDGTTGK